MIIESIDGYSAPAAHDWPDCSIDCGLGTSTNGDETRTCPARSGKYYRVPQFPNDLNQQLLCSLSMMGKLFIHNTKLKIIVPLETHVIRES